MFFKYKTLLIFLQLIKTTLFSVRTSLNKYNFIVQFDKIINLLQDLKIKDTPLFNKKEASKNVKRLFEQSFTGDKQILKTKKIESSFVSLKTQTIIMNDIIKSLMKICPRFKSSFRLFVETLKSLEQINKCINHFQDHQLNVKNYMSSPDEKLKKINNGSENEDYRVLMDFYNDFTKIFYDYYKYIYECQGILNLLKNSFICDFEKNKKVYDNIKDLPLYKLLNDKINELLTENEMTFSKKLLKAENEAHNTREQHIRRTFLNKKEGYDYLFVSKHDENFKHFKDLSKKTLQMLLYAEYLRILTEKDLKVDGKITNMIYLNSQLHCHENEMHESKNILEISLLKDKTEEIFSKLRDFISSNNDKIQSIEDNFKKDLNKLKNTWYVIKMNHSYAFKSLNLDENKLKEKLCSSNESIILFIEKFFTSVKNIIKESFIDDKTRFDLYFKYVVKIKAINNFLETCKQSVEKFLPKESELINTVKSECDSLKLKLKSLKSAMNNYLRKSKCFENGDVDVILNQNNLFGEILKNLINELKRYKSFFIRYLENNRLKEIKRRLKAKNIDFFNLDFDDLLSK